MDIDLDNFDVKSQPGFQTASLCLELLCCPRCSDRDRRFTRNQGRPILEELWRSLAAYQISRGPLLSMSILTQEDEDINFKTKQSLSDFRTLGRLNLLSWCLSRLLVGRQSSALSVSRWSDDALAQPRARGLGFDGSHIRDSCAQLREMRHQTAETIGPSAIRAETGEQTPKMKIMRG